MKVLNNLDSLDNIQDGNTRKLITKSSELINDANFEVDTNKVTSISNLSTDTQYPSAKCIYTLIGNLEDLLKNINSGNGGN